MHRRGFIGRAVAAGAAAASGVPWRAAWASPGGPRESLRLVVFSDVHARKEWETPRAMAMAAKAMNACRPEAIIANGDLITEGFESSVERVAHRWEIYGAMHETLAAPVVPVIGNHDLVAAAPEDGSEAAVDPRAVFLKFFKLERSYRAFDALGYHVVCLDAIVVDGAEHAYVGRVDAEQLAWLAADLATVDPATPIILCSHVPLLTGFYQATEGATTAAPANRVITNSRELLALFEKHRLQVVLQSHLHVNEMLRWQDTTFITTGALSGKWWRGSWHGTDAGFGVLTLQRDRVEWEYRNSGWTPLRP